MAALAEDDALRQFCDNIDDLTADADEIDKLAFGTRWGRGTLLLTRLRSAYLRFAPLNEVEIAEGDALSKRVSAALGLNPFPETAYWRRP